MASDIFSGMPPTGVNYTHEPVVAQPDNIKVNDAVSASNVSNPNALQSDTVELSNAPKEKKGIIRSFKDSISNIKKFIATTSAYTKGTFKGLIQGFTAGSVIYTLGSILNVVRAKAAQKAGKEITKIPNKAIAMLVGAVTVGVNIFTASLNATEANSNIDHRWSGHNK